MKENYIDKTLLGGTPTPLQDQQILNSTKADELFQRFIKSISELGELSDRLNAFSNRIDLKPDTEEELKLETPNDFVSRFNYQLTFLEQKVKKIEIAVIRLENFA